MATCWLGGCLHAYFVWCECLPQYSHGRAFFWSIFFHNIPMYSMIWPQRILPLPKKDIVAKRSRIRIHCQSCGNKVRWVASKFDECHLSVWPNISLLQMLRLNFTGLLRSIGIRTDITHTTDTYKWKPLCLVYMGNLAKQFSQIINCDQFICRFFAIHDVISILHARVWKKWRRWMASGAQALHYYARNNFIALRTYIESMAGCVVCYDYWLVFWLHWRKPAS